jgi:peptide/nickel transport system substrate-binding protein
VAAIVMVVVLVVVGAGSFIVFNQTKPTNTVSTSCAPATSYVCKALLANHDMTLLAPFPTTQSGTPVPFTASFSKGESSSSFSFNFGDGTPLVNTSSPTVTHVFTNPGTYLVSVTALVGSVTHDNYQSLASIVVEPSTASSHLGNAPSVLGMITRNSSSVSAPSAVVAAGGSIEVSGSYSSAPTNPAFVPSAPTIVTDGGAAVSLTQGNATATSATATAVANSPGIYTVTFVGKATAGTTVDYQNYTWTLFAAASGVHAGVVASSGSSRSPHPGVLNIYTLAPGGSTSEDPAVDYESVGYEPILNVYQTLIQYNGSDSGPGYQNFVPELAACVPGSPQCTALFNTNLTNGANYTFVINGASQFYDPSTGSHWGVYPSDVVFSLARTMGFATEPAFADNNGWIVSQALLSRGNSSWDSGYHATLNNTPADVFAAVQANETGDCPAAAMAAPYHGCVTFHADANDVTWAYFLELVAQPFGSSVVPCGWFSAPAQAAGIPGWTYGAEKAGDNGDHPCTLPGGATSSSQASFTSNVSAMTPTEWDNWELHGSGTAVSGQFWGNTQWSMVGSGPYYMASLKIGQSYLMKANPDYVQSPYCTWSACEPPVHGYAATVSVLWESSQLPGEEAYASGTADFASIPPTDAALLLQLIQEGKVTATTFPSISIYFFIFTMDFLLSGAQKYSSNPITVPTDFFSNLGVRQFFVNAYPYATTQNTINTKDGIQYFFNYGGSIPQFMGQYYPTNVSFPSGDPANDASTTGSAAWWWAQLTDHSSPWYDAELASCSAANPCQVPFFGETGAPSVDEELALWASEIATLSGGAIKMNVLDIDFTDLVINSLYSGPYQNPMPMYELGWAPDYPDPTDYMVAMYQPDGSYTHADAVSEQLEGAPNYGVGAYNASVCTSVHPYTDLGYWSSMASSVGGVNNTCQGAAYAALSYGAAQAAHMPSGQARILMYNMVEHIANALALYVYWGQENIVLTYAPWINGASANDNVVIGGSADNTWYSITGNGVASSSS